MKYAADPKILKYQDPSEVTWGVIEPIWDDLPLTPSSKLNSFMAMLSDGQRALLALDWCQKEIRNGGFLQLFGNATGNLVPWAIDGSRLVSAVRYEDLLEKAVAVLGAEYPSSATARRRACAQLASSQKRRLEKLEQAFLDALDESASDLAVICAQYVRSHPEQFVIGRSAG
jgi:hypothetical protein